MKSLIYLNRLVKGIVFIGILFCSTDALASDTKFRPKHSGYLKYGFISGSSIQLGYSRKFFKATYISIHAENVTYQPVGFSLWYTSEPFNIVNSDPENRTYLGIRIGRKMKLSKSGRSSFHLSGGWAFVRDNLTAYDQFASTIIESEEYTKRNHVAFIFTTEFEKWYTDHVGAILGFSGGSFDNNKGDFLLTMGVKFTFPKKE